MSGSRRRRLASGLPSNNKRPLGICVRIHNTDLICFYPDCGSSRTGFHSMVVLYVLFSSWLWESSRTGFHFMVVFYVFSPWIWIFSHRFSLCGRVLRFVFTLLVPFFALWPVVFYVLFSLWLWIFLYRLSIYGCVLRFVLTLIVGLLAPTFTLWSCLTWGPSPPPSSPPPVIFFFFFFLFVCRCVSVWLVRWLAGWLVGCMFDFHLIDNSNHQNTIRSVTIHTTAAAQTVLFVWAFCCLCFAFVLIGRLLLSWSSNKDAVLECDSVTVVLLASRHTPAATGLSWVWLARYQ